MTATAMSVVDKKYCSDGERELTVRKTSVFFPGDGFEAYDHCGGELVFRVDTYQDRGPKNALAHDHQLVLMDPYGSPILTVRRKWPSLHQRWEGFVGERSEGQKPFFSVRRSSIFGEGRSVVTVNLHSGRGSGSGSGSGGSCEYRIEGSFAQRNCRIVLYNDNNHNSEKDLNFGDCQDDDDMEEETAAAADDAAAAVVIAAEIKRKVEPCANVVLSKDVFCLCIKPRIDAAFVMGLVLVLDQITGDGDYGQQEQDQQDFSSSQVHPQ